MTSDWFTSCFDETYIALDRLRYPASLNRERAIQLIHLLEMQRTEAWLDACCGYGRYLLPLVALGYQVTGVDLSKDMIHALEAGASQLNLVAKAVRCDIREIPFIGHFHGAFLLGSSFGIFDDPGQDILALKRIHDSLRPHGRFLIEQFNPAALLPSTDKAVARVFQIKEQQVEESVIRDERRGYIFMRRRLRRGSWERKWVMRYRMYNEHSLSQALREAGFVPTGLYGDIDGRPFTSESPHIVLRSNRKS